MDITMTCTPGATPARTRVGTSAGWFGASGAVLSGAAGLRVPAPTYRHGRHVATHNSTVSLAAAELGRAMSVTNVISAKQAGPPRGIPR